MAKKNPVIFKEFCYYSPKYPFLGQNHFLPIITPKPAYIYLKNFSKENFPKKILVPWDPLGYLGSLSWDPPGRIFSKCVFLNLLSPLGLPIPSNVLGSSKKLKFFPRGCVFILIINSYPDLRRIARRRLDPKVFRFKVSVRLLHGGQLISPCVGDSVEDCP